MIHKKFLENTIEKDQDSKTIKQQIDDHHRQIVEAGTYEPNQFYETALTINR